MLPVWRVILSGVLGSGLLTCVASVDSGITDGGGQSDLCEGVTCSEGFTCLEGACVPEDPCLTVVCDGEGEECSGGRCVSCESDQDGDGYEACVDCDDGNAGIGPGSEEPCETRCAMGTVRCLGVAGWSTCSAPVECECEPGATRTEPCGRCGSVQRTCGADGIWEEDPGECSEVGECVPGAIGTQSCGECAEQQRECTAECVWGPWSDCGGPEGCAPGETEQQDCDDVGVRTRTCGEDCSWGAWSNCGAGGECVPGAVSEEDCEQCGTRGRTCTDAQAWGDWGACEDQGPCSPGATENQACGNCGTKTRTCGADCQWGAWGGCGGEGACTPDATRDGGCDPCAYQVCSDQCAWGGCVLRAGSECEWQEGTHWRCCGSSRWQFCLPNSCEWSTDCDICQNNGCGCN
ncbi:MAG: hypothetical protein HYY06_25895 [Deltaproteobacteria bacterium]|nr:hypothetical protein [Deltaproteobacteria bacterium]